MNSPALRGETYGNGSTKIVPAPEGPDTHAPTLHRFVEFYAGHPLSALIFVVGSIFPRLKPAAIHGPPLPGPHRRCPESALRPSSSLRGEERNATNPAVLVQERVRGRYQEKAALS